MDHSDMETVIEFQAKVAKVSNGYILEVYGEEGEEELLVFSDLDSLIASLKNLKDFLEEEEEDNEIGPTPKE